MSIICFGIIVVTAGCTRSIPANYNADMTRANNASALEKVTLGVALFEDKRGWVDASDSQSESYIARQGFWKFGLTFQDKDYTPVKDVMQSVLIKEFKNAGINTKSISQVISKQNINKVWELSAKDKYDYVLGGQILAFEFVNDTGWTISSRRSVTLNLIMAKIDGQKVLLDTTYAETQSENEGMGVMHTTNMTSL